MLNNMFYQKMCYGGQIKFTGPKKGKDQGLGVRKQITKPVTRSISGGLVTEYPDGTIETLFFDTGTRKIKYPDGKITKKFRDGTEDNKDRFGNKIRTFTDGTEETKDRFGNEKIVYSDTGKEKTKDRFGNEKIVYSSTGKEKTKDIFGNETIVYRNTGKEKTKDIFGNITRTFKDGTKKATKIIKVDASRDIIIKTIERYGDKKQYVFLDQKNGEEYILFEKNLNRGTVYRTNEVPKNKLKKLHDILITKSLKIRKELGVFLKLMK